MLSLSSCEVRQNRILIFIKNLNLFIQFYKDGPIIDPTTHIRSHLENDFSAHSYPCTSIAMKFDINMFYKNLNLFVKLYKDRYIIDPIPQN
ncbi:hypothetical protein CVS40_4836 [Lucilia cuprina]|nr:hypothetical protein CVS40_4836 [Lucilia cuprina]